MADSTPGPLVTVGTRVVRVEPIEARYLTPLTCPLYRGEPDRVVRVIEGNWFSGEKCHPDEHEQHWWRIGMYREAPEASVLKEQK